MQHAHQKGIVHRDLKPTNVLVTIYDAKAVPKVIDFGVAKAAGGQLLPTRAPPLSSRFVVSSAVHGARSKPDFRDHLVVDTRADIYYLGVILYELLTGLRPFDTKRLRRAGGRSTN